jgi:endonuclease/exonuclease/phosphatase family metal-dependent hydrolase
LDRADFARRKGSQLTFSRSVRATTKAFLVTPVTLSVLGFVACSGSSNGAAPTGDAGTSADAAAASDSANDGSLVTLADGAPASLAHVRIVTGNLSTGNNQNYDGGEGARIFTALKADVILIQEFNVGDKTPAAARTFVDTVCGADCAYFQQDPATYNIPNGIISRFPIKASGTWDDPQTTDRDFAWAQIDVPGPIDLVAVSVHLLTTGATQRATQATTLVNFVKTNVPAGSFLTIGGDFNTDDRSEDAPLTLDGVVDTDGPYPADGAHNEFTNAPRNKPYDWVTGNPDLMAWLVPVSIGAQSFAAGLVVDTRVFTPISDLAPALATDSAATNMQHMAVVRDFMIPSE